MANGIIRFDEGWRFDDGHHFDQPPNVSFPVPPEGSKKSKGTKHMDMIPKKRAERRQWYTNISDNVVAEAVKMGAPLRNRHEGTLLPRQFESRFFRNIHNVKRAGRSVRRNVRPPYPG